MSQPVVTDYFVVNYTANDMDDYPHFVTDVNNKHQKEIGLFVSPTAKTIYTSKLNAWYLKSFVGANPDNIIGLELKKTYKLEFQGKDSVFTLIPSFSNSGSVSLLIYGEFGTYMITGSCNNYGALYEIPVVKSVIEHNALSRLYFDATYYESKFEFRGIDDVCNIIANIICSEKSKPICMAIDPFGLEFLLPEIIHLVRKKHVNDVFFIDQILLDAITVMGWEYLFTTDPKNARVFIVPSILHLRRRVGVTVACELIKIRREPLLTKDAKSYVKSSNMHMFTIFAHCSREQCHSMFAKLKPQECIPLIDGDRVEVNIDNLPKKIKLSNSVLKNKTCNTRPKPIETQATPKNSKPKQQIASSSGKSLLKSSCSNQQNKFKSPLKRAKIHKNPITIAIPKRIFHENSSQDLINKNNLSPRILSNQHTSKDMNPLLENSTTPNGLADPLPNSIFKENNIRFQSKSDTNNTNQSIVKLPNIPVVVAITDSNVKPLNDQSVSGDIGTANINDLEMIFDDGSDDLFCDKNCEQSTDACQVPKVIASEDVEKNSDVPINAKQGDTVSIVDEINNSSDCIDKGNQINKFDRQTSTENIDCSGDKLDQCFINYIVKTSKIFKESSSCNNDTNCNFPFNNNSEDSRVSFLGFDSDEDIENVNKIKCSISLPSNSKNIKLYRMKQLILNKLKSPKSTEKDKSSINMFDLNKIPPLPVNGNTEIGRSLINSTVTNFDILKKQAKQLTFCTVLLERCS